jgi:hypothetical protein
VAVGDRIRGLGYDVLDIGLRSVELGLQAALGAVGLLRTGAEAVLGGPQPEVPQTSDEERPPARPSPPPRPPRVAERPPPEPPEPDHVDEGVTPVAEFAEPGAEDGAGAEIDVDEPWDGYDAMRAPEIQRALAEASPAALGAVRLYESMHKGRRSVLDAVDRRLAQTQ